MAVTVEPNEFNFVFFNADEVAAVARNILTLVGMGDRNLHVEVDETTPIARVWIADGDPIVFKAESGAFEDTRRPRHFGESVASLSIGRMLMRLRDRSEAGFADAPADDALDLAQVSAWDTYAVGRLRRAGMDAHEPRWRYNFRNRHGFSDQVDGAFQTIWSAEQLTWSELNEISSACHTVPAPR